MFPLLLYWLWCCRRPPYNDIRWNIEIMEGES